jgi:hypothetical protein
VARGNGEERQDLKLSEAAQTLLDECRMVLPGIQALFGFQLIAVFNQRFAELAAREQHLHLAAIALVVLAVGLLMTPAALHRSLGSRQVTRTFIHVSSRLLLASMVPLVLALSIDVYVVASLVVDASAACMLAALAFVVLSLLWFLFPRRFRVIPQ